jgi:hypothetical protein
MPSTGHLHLCLPCSLCALQPPSTVVVASSSAATRHFPTTMAGKSQILPTDVWAHSLVMERKLEELVHNGLLRPRASWT